MRYFFRFSLCVAFLLLLDSRFLSAHEADEYKHIVDTGTLSGLRHGPNAIQFMLKKVPMVIKTKIPVTLLNASSVTTQGALFGRYLSPKGTVDLELHVQIDKGQLEVNITPAQIDAIVFEWEEMYSTPTPLKTLKPQMKRLTFHEGQGLRYDCLLKRKFDYLLVFDIGYDHEQKKLADVMPELAAVNKFIASIEGELRGRTILSNNKSGLAAFIVFGPNADGAKIIHLHHPMHDIRYNRDTKVFDYFYLDSVADVAVLPEIKRLLTNEDIRKFVMESTEPVQVRVSGNPTSSFSCVFTRVNSRQQLSAQLHGKKIVVGG